MGVAYTGFHLVGAYVLLRLELRRSPTITCVIFLMMSNGIPSEAVEQDWGLLKSSESNSSL